MKLSLDALKERAEATASTELLDTISGGTTNSCHPIPPKELPPVAKFCMFLIDAINSTR